MKFNQHRRRGATATFVVVTMPVLLGFAALTIDVAALHGTRTDLQDAADAAALSGASVLASDAMLQVHLEGNASSAVSVVSSTSITRIKSIASQFDTFGKENLGVENGDISLGWIDVTSATSSLVTTGDPVDYNAVQVIVRRSSTGTNGPVSLMFASIFGMSTSDVSASAVAVFNDRFSALETASAGPAILPLTMDINEYNSQLAAGGDNYGYDSSTSTIDTSSDGLPEVDPYPIKSSPGNFGLLNIGLPSMGTPGLADHITNGVPPEDFVTEIGTSEVVFYQDDGTPVTYDIGGDPGITASLEPSFATHLGEPVSFFLHDSVTGTGSGSVYHIVGMRWGRLMDVSLKSGTKQIIIQPMTYYGSGVRTTPGAPKSGGVAGKLMLAR